MKKTHLLSALLFAALLLGSTSLSMAQYVYETVYSETFGDSVGTTAVADYEGYDDLSVTYSGSSVTIRSTNPATAADYATASGPSLLYMGAQNGYFQIDGMNTTGYDNFELRFGMRKNSTAHDLSSLSVAYSTDNETWTNIPLTDWSYGVDSDYVSGVAADFPTGGGTTGWYYISCNPDSNTIPADTSVSFRFTMNATGQIRIDDILLIGARPVPYLTINKPLAGTYGPCDSLSLDVTVGHFNVSLMGEQDGYVKIESNLLAAFGVPNPCYANSATMGLLNTLPKFVLPDGNYYLIMTLVDNDSIAFESLATDTVNVLIQSTQAATPTFTPAAGDYHFPQTVEIACTTDDAVIYYTLDGTAPDSVNGALYTEAIELTNDTTTIKAIAYASCFTVSEVAEATFTKDVTGIEAYAAANVRIAPNPATSVLNVAAKGFNTVEVLNFLGQVVYSGNLNNDNVQINVSDLNAGVYFVRLQNGNNIVTKKFIKK